MKTMGDESERMRVLVVDDEQDVREMLQSIVSAEGYLVTAVADGAAAIEAANGQRFALATIDLRMPGRSGREVLAELRAVAPEMIAIIVSGYITPAEAQACRSLGAFAIVKKPFTVSALVATLARGAVQYRARDTRLAP